VWLGGNKSATRIGGEDATLREDSGLGCRYVELRRRRRVDELVECHVKVGVGEQSILMIPAVVEHHAAFCSGDDQSSMFVDGVFYFQSPSIPESCRDPAPLHHLTGSAIRRQVNTDFKGGSSGVSDGGSETLRLDRIYTWPTPYRPWNGRRTSVARAVRRSWAAALGLRATSERDRVLTRGYGP
jgi:hypothetical protein